VHNDNKPSIHFHDDNISINIITKKCLQNPKNAELSGRKMLQYKKHKQSANNGHFYDNQSLAMQVIIISYFIYVNFIFTLLHFYLFKFSVKPNKNQ